MMGKADAHSSNGVVAGCREWNGEGLPPAGIECIIHTYEKSPRVQIDFISEHVVVYTETGSGKQYSASAGDVKFSPLRTPADIERDEAIYGISCLISGDAKPNAEDVYDAIVSGKIPGLGKVGQ